MHKILLRRQPHLARDRGVDLVRVKTNKVQLEKVLLICQPKIRNHQFRKSQLNRSIQYHQTI
jgi:hypothetical protein